MKTTLIVLSVVEVLALVVVLAGYLIVIARSLRTTSRTLGLVTFGVRAIERQTEAVGPLLTGVNDALTSAAYAAGISLEAGGEQPQGAVEHARRQPEVADR